MLYFFAISVLGVRPRSTSSKIFIFVFKSFAEYFPRLAMTGIVDEASPTKHRGNERGDTKNWLPVRTNKSRTTTTNARYSWAQRLQCFVSLVTLVACCACHAIPGPAQPPQHNKNLQRLAPEHWRRRHLLRKRNSCRSSVRARATLMARAHASGGSPLASPHVRWLVFLFCCFASVVNLVWFGFATHCNHSGPTSSARSNVNQRLPVRINPCGYRRVRIIGSFPPLKYTGLVPGPGCQFELTSFYCIRLWMNKLCDQNYYYLCEKMCVGILLCFFS